MDLFPVQPPLSFFSLFHQIVPDIYSLTDTVISRSMMFGRTAVNLDEGVTWPHSGSSCTHTRSLKCVFACSINTSKVIIWEFMRLCIPSINGPTIHIIFGQLNICVLHETDCRLRKINVEIM